MSLETIISICLGIALSSASGFRVFLPVFVLSLASYFDFVTINENWSWVSELPVMICFGVAMLFEIFGYYIPFIDNLLDTIATPLAIIAGYILVAATIIDLSPFFTIVIAIVAGSGSATVFQGLTSTARAASSLKTAGLGNAIVSTTETGTAITLSTMAIFVPIIAIVSVLIIFGMIYWIYRKIKS